MGEKLKKDAYKIGCEEGWETKELNGWRSDADKVEWWGSRGGGGNHGIFILSNSYLLTLSLVTI